MSVTLWMMATVGAFALGANDGANSTAAAVGAGLLDPRAARRMAALAGGAGAWLAGERVVGTLAQELVPFHLLGLQEAQALAVVALAAASLWVLAATALGLPVSTSHALVGALAGAALQGGTVPVDLGVLGAIAGSWVWVPAGAAGAGLVAAVAGRLPGTRWLRRMVAPLVRACSAWMAFWWGANDVANAVALAAQVGGLAWGASMAVGAACLAAGTYWGSGRVLATMASGLGPLGPPEALAVQGSVALVLPAATLMGYPVSTTHAVVSALAGVLWARGRPVNRRQVARVATAWLLTAPAAGLLAWLLAGI